MHQTEVIAYYRRSTDNGQVHSVEAQRIEVEEFCKKHGLKIIKTFQETESGKSIQRPVLQQTIKMSNTKKVPIIILRLDRLGRTASEVIDLALNQKLIIVEHGMHQYDRFAINLMATFAEREREVISKRTKQGLRAAKAKGITLGNPRFKDAQRKSAQKRKLKAQKYAQKMEPLFQKFKHLNNRELAEVLNECNIPTRTGEGVWHPESVRRIRGRLRKNI